MSPLALVAMLLLVLVPTIGRLVSAGHDPSSVGVHHHTHMATAHAQLMSESGHGDAHAPMPRPTGGGMPMHEDCAYCPVLNSMVSLALWFVFALPIVTMPPYSGRRALLPRIRRWHPCGLGSRGPPIAL